MSRTMKDSGIPWIGEIPSHWDTCFIKQVMRNKSVKGYPDEQVLSLYRDYGVVPKDSRDDNHNVTSEDTSGYKLVDVGDFVINKMKAWQGSMAVSEYRGIISPAYYICRFTAPVYKKYIHYLLRNETYKAEYMRLSTGLRVGQWDLNVDDFLHIPMVLPPIPEQQAIADFLDKKCSEIDEMVLLQENIVEELKAYKQSVITEAVCKGLNPNVPMKDSGIEWIGEIPEGWKAKRLKYVGYGENGLTYSPSDMCGEEGVLVLRSSNIQGSKLVLTDNVYVSCSIPEKLFVKKGDIIICSRNGSAALVGKCALVEDEINASFGAFMLRFRTSLYNRYAYYLLTGVISNYKQLFSTTTINQLTLGTFNNLYAPVATEDKEQQAIADYLDTKCAGRLEGV